MTYTHVPRSVAILIGLALIAHVLLVLPLPVAWRGAAAELLLGLPGILVALWLFGSERDPLLLGFLGLCGGIGLQVLLLLALHSLPGPLLWWLVLLPCDALSGLIFWMLVRQPPDSSEQAPERSLYTYLLLVVLLLGAALRFPFLGSAEFQGDEARALLLALDAVNGWDGVLLLHSKGPVEGLLPAGLLALVGNINEWAARLPFALAGVGVLLGSYVLARRMFASELGPRGSALAGVIAATILALDGFLIAFSRIVQYQNVLVLMMLGALWCCWRFYEGACRPQRYLVCAAGLAAVGLLAHYDGAFVLPALAWLVLAGGWRRGWRAAEWLRGLAAPVLVGAGLTASFYVPFVLNEHFSHTAHYLEKRTGQSGLISNLFENLSDYYRLATFYNTTFQIHWLAVALAAAGLAWLWIYGRPRMLGWALAALLLLGCVLLAREPWRFALQGGGNWAIAAFALPIAGLALAPATPPALRTLVFWFAPPFVAESFLFANPMTHFYAMDAAAALLVGLAIAQLAGSLRAHRLAWLQAPLALGGAALVLLAAPYMYLVFVRQAPEYRHVFPAARPAIYQAVYRDKLPTKDGYFGFPHRAGWKVIGELYRRGVLHGDFESNEDYLITHWYTRKTSRCDSRPVYYFLAQTPLDPVKVPIKQIQQNYRLFGSVLVDGVKKIDIYSRQPVTQPPQIFTLGDYTSAFDGYPITNFSMQRTWFEIIPQDQPATQWQQGVSLQHSDLRRQQLVPGQGATLEFHWQAAQPLDPDYEVFVDIIDGSGRTVAGVTPLCRSAPPAEWHMHDANDTTFTLTADSSVPAGQYTLRIGLRRAQTGARLPLADGADTLTVAMLNVAGQ